MDNSSNIFAMARRDGCPAPILKVEGLSVWFGGKQVLNGLSFDLGPSEVLALAGGSGSGRTTALKCLKRMHDGTPDARVEGRILMDGRDVHGADIQPVRYRRRFGWIGSQPNPLPISIYENLAYGARQNGQTRTRGELAALAEACLRRVDLWDDVKDGIYKVAAQTLSPDHQQRLCIATALAGQPEVLLMDDPTVGLEKDEADRLEVLIRSLRTDHAIVVAVSDPQQARRLADRVAVLHEGRLVEFGKASEVLAAPRTPEAQAFLQGAQAGRPRV